MEHPQDLLKLTGKEQLDIFLKKLIARIPLHRALFRTPNRRRRNYKKHQYTTPSRTYEKKLYSKVVKNGEFRWFGGAPQLNRTEYRFYIGELKFLIVVDQRLEDVHIEDVHFVIPREDKEPIRRPIFESNIRGDVYPMFRWWFERHVQERFCAEYAKLFDVTVNEDTLDSIIIERGTKGL